MSTEPDWADIRKKLAASLPLDVIKFRVGNAPKDGKPGSALAYIDARVVMDLLDDIVGPDHWTFDFDTISTGAQGEVQSAKGKLTIHGVTKCDVGDMSRTEPSKSAVSDALKRAAVQWGIGRELYEMPYLRLMNDRIGAEDKARFRAIIQRHRANQDTDDETPAEPRQQASKPAQAAAATSAPVDADTPFGDERPAKPLGALGKRAKLVGWDWDEMRSKALRLPVEMLPAATKTTPAQQETILTFLEEQEAQARTASLRTSDAIPTGAAS